MKIRKILSLLVLGLLVTNFVSGPIIVRSLPIVPIAAAIIAGVIGGVIGYIWGSMSRDVGTPAEVIGEVINQLYLLDIYKSDLLNTTLYSSNLYIPRMSNYYIRWSESIASTECVNQVRSFEESSIQETVVKELDTLFNNITSLVIRTYSYYLATSRALAYRVFLLNNRYETYIPAPGPGVIVKSDTEIYIGLYVYDGMIKIGSICRLVLFIEYDDNTSEEIVLGTFRLGYTDYKVSTSIKVLEDLSKGYRNGKQVKSWDVNGYCVGPILPELRSDVNKINGTMIFLDFKDEYKQFIGLLVGLYNEVRISYEMYCTIINLGGGQPIPPPSVTLPFNLDDLQKLPPELRMQIYYAYLNALMNVDWSRIKNLTMTNVNTSTPGIIYGGGYSLIPLVIPYYIPVVKGYPIPLFGTWMVNGSIVNYQTLPIDPNIHTWERIGNTTLYWIKDKSTGQTLGVGIDLNNDGKPDVFSQHYVIVDRITEWNPNKQSWDEKDETTFGPKTVDEWIKETRIDEYLKRLEEQNRELVERMNDLINTLKDFFGRFKLPSFNINKWILVAAGVILLLIIIIAVAGGGRTIVVGR
ncbi:MAG: hypothetical protein QW607_05545 [Desulfurococcaceae archaeon]